MHRAALAYGERGVPAFPCRPGGKAPLTAHGHLEATTDPRKINALWNRYPGANIGVPTGKRSGFFVLDVDEGGEEALAALEREHGKLPPTFTVRTGSGGRHLYFKWPEGAEIRNSVGRVGVGLDVRGEGGYVVASPSQTEGPYEVLDKLPMAEAPGWLLEAAREPSRPQSGETGGATVSAEADGPTIIAGGRNHELARIAGTLHDGSRDLSQLTADLLAINAARCEPPLPEAEVEKVAGSIHRRKPCRQAAPKASPEALEALGGVEARFWRAEWKGMGWKSARDVVVVLIEEARKHGRLIPAGVRVTLSIRDLALAAGISKPSTYKAIRRLKEAGWLRQDNGERSGTEAGAFVLRANVDHSPTGEASASVGASGKPLRAPFTAPRLRWSRPHYEREGDELVRTTVYRLGKTAGAVLDALELAGGSMGLGELADVLGAKRPRDLRRRAVARLESAGVVSVSGDLISLSSGWLAALEAERERARELEDHRRDARRYADERLMHRVELLAGRGLPVEEIAARVGITAARVRDLLGEPDEAPTRAEMDELRRRREERALPAGADGYIEDLERVEEPVVSALTAVLRDYLGRNPGHSREPAGWLANTLWALELYPGKPTREEVAAALDELGGDAYLRRISAYGMAVVAM
jgi:transposase